MRILVGKIIALVLLVSLLLGLFVTGIKELRPEKHQVEIPDYKPWSQEVLDIAASLPVQEGGRIKPLETRASYAMLQMRGDRRLTIIGKDEREGENRPHGVDDGSFLSPRGGGTAAELPG